MLKLRIIPTLLFKNLKLVKGKNFDSWRTTQSIMTAVRVYNLRQVDELVLLDISATNLGKKIDLELVNEVSNECFIVSRKSRYSSKNDDFFSFSRSTISEL